MLRFFKAPSVMSIGLARVTYLLECCKSVLIVLGLETFGAFRGLLTTHDLLVCLFAREICARSMNSCIMKQESMIINDYGHWTHSNKLGISCIVDFKVCVNVCMRARMRVCIFKCASMYACMRARTPDHVFVSRYAYV